MAEMPLIHSVTFAEDMIEITYVEEREQTDRVALMRTCIFDPAVARGELEEARTAVNELLDAVLLAMRQPKRNPYAKDDDDD
jgi:hypothetical protein